MSYNDEAQLATVAGPCRWSVDCSICGAPFEQPWEPDSGWLKHIMLLVQKSDCNSVEAIPANLADFATELSTIDYEAWRSSKIPPGPIGMPMHRNCFNIVQLVLKQNSSRLVQEDNDGCPQSLNDVYDILRVRAEESFVRVGFDITRIFEPNGYYVTNGRAGTGYWGRHELVAQDNWWHSDPMELRLKTGAFHCPNPMWQSHCIPSDVARIVFEYTYADPTDLSKDCQYIFPQRWWYDILKNFDWLDGVQWKETCPEFDWEKLVRRISVIHREYLACTGPSSFRNRRRIFKLVSEMRAKDMIDLRTRYCHCIFKGFTCQVWHNEGESWCRKSWKAIQLEECLPENWVPELLDYHE